MCNLYSLTTAQQAMRGLFNVAPGSDHLGNYGPQSAIFPDAEVPIVRVDKDGDRALRYARWGWNKAPFGWVTNARNLSSFPWKFALTRLDQRCLVPASSFSEHHPTEKIPGKSGKPIKAASWFRLLGGEERPPFAFAGLCRMWNWEKDGLRKPADAELADQNAPTLAMTFLTTEPNEIVAPIHPKAMPVILRSAEDFETWLTGSAEDAMALQRPLPADEMELVFTGEKADAVT